LANVSQNYSIKTKGSRNYESLCINMAAQVLVEARNSANTWMLKILLETMFNKSDLLFFPCFLQITGFYCISQLI